MPSPGHVSKRKPPMTSIPRPTSIQQSFQCSLCLACSFHTLQFTHCSLSLLTFCNLCPQSTPSICPSREFGLSWLWQVWPLFSQVVRPGWAGVDRRGVPAECSILSFIVYSPRPHNHQENTISVALLEWGSMHRSPAQAATAQSPRCPRMPSREPQRRLACRHRGTHLPRHPRGRGGVAAGRPKRDRA